MNKKIEIKLGIKTEEKENDTGFLLLLKDMNLFFNKSRHL